MVRRCAPKSEIYSILTFCDFYACGGHFRGQRLAAKVLQSGFFWPTLFRDAHQFCLAYEHCQCLSRRDMMPLSPILIVEIFDV